MRNIFLAMALAVLGVVASPSVPAQDATPAASSVTGASTYSDAELKSFAAAALDIQRIRDVYVDKLAAADDGDEQDQLLEAAGRDMSGAVERQGLSVERFHEILVAARGDDALVARINKHLNQ